MPKTFYIMAGDINRSSVMTSIQVTLPDHMRAGEYVRWEDGAHSGTQWKANPDAVAFSLGRIVEELARYGLSEALAGSCYEPPSTK